MRKTVFIILLSISLVVLLVRFGIKPLTALLGYQQRGGIKITSLPSARVFLDDNEVGTTPFQSENLKPGEHGLKLLSTNSDWQGKVNIPAGTLAVVNREISDSIASSSGEVLTLVKGKGAVIVSNPAEALVEIDGKVIGTTPLAATDIAVGEHTFILSHPNYLKRSVRAYVADKLALQMVVDLAITEADLASLPSSTPAITTLIVKDTPTGFLRVRDRPSLSASEISRVSPGDRLTLLEESGSWLRVKTPDNKEGYVASSYIEKKTQ